MCRYVCRDVSRRTDEHLHCLVQHLNSLYAHTHANADVCTHFYAHVCLCTCLEQQEREQWARDAKVPKVETTINALGLSLVASDIENAKHLLFREQTNLLCLPGMSFGTFENHKVPKVIAVRPLPVPQEMINKWAQYSSGKLQSWAWHGTSVRCLGGTCQRPECNLCQITAGGFQVDLCDKNNEVCRHVGNVTFLAFAAAHAAVFADQTETITGVRGQRVVILSRVVTGIAIPNDRHEYPHDNAVPEGKTRAEMWEAVLRQRSDEGCYYGGQCPSGNGINTLLSWNNANILPLYAVQVEAVEPFKTREELERNRDFARKVWPHANGAHKSDDFWNGNAYYIY